MTPQQQFSADAADKLAWMHRSLARMRGAVDSPIDFQDNFWSFISGLRCLYFYLGVFAKTSGGSGGEVTDRWKASIPPEQRAAWDLVVSWRTYDTHTRPVPPKEVPNVLTWGDQELAWGDEPLAWGSEYVVQHNGADTVAIPMCELAMLSAVDFVENVLSFA